MFAVNRKVACTGCGVKSGQWIFEEFMFTDGILGEAVVSYEAKWNGPYIKRDRLLGIGERDGEMEIFDAKMVSVKVFNDDGDEMPLTEDDVLACSKMVLGRFAEIERDVQDFEMGLL
jgi:hypothetical protein